MDGVLALRVLTPDRNCRRVAVGRPETRVLEPVLVIDATLEPAAAAAARLVADELDLPDGNATTFSLLWELRSEDLQQP